MLTKMIIVINSHPLWDEGSSDRAIVAFDSFHLAKPLALFIV